MVPLQPLLFSLIALIIIGQNRVWGQEIIPNLKEQVIQAGTDLKLTCRLHPNTPGDGRINWELPDSIRTLPDLSDGNNRSNRTIGPGPRESTMILSKTRPKDTGFYGCTTTFVPTCPFLNDTSTSQVGNEKLIFIDLPTANSGLIVLRVRKGQDLLIPCKPTNPNVSVSLIHRNQISSLFTPNELKEFWLTDKVFVRDATKISLNGRNSRCTFDPKEGIKLKDATISDYGRWICQGENDGTIIIRKMMANKNDVVVLIAMLSCFSSVSSYDFFQPRVSHTPDAIAIDFAGLGSAPFPLGSGYSQIADPGYIPLNPYPPAASYFYNMLRFELFK